MPKNIILRSTTDTSLTTSTLNNSEFISNTNVQQNQNQTEANGFIIPQSTSQIFDKQNNSSNIHSMVYDEFIDSCSSFHKGSSQQDKQLKEIQMLIKISHPNLSSRLSMIRQQVLEKEKHSNLLESKLSKLKFRLELLERQNKLLLKKLNHKNVEQVKLNSELSHNKELCKILKERQRQLEKSMSDLRKLKSRTSIGIQTLHAFTSTKHPRSLSQVNATDSPLMELKQCNFIQVQNRVLINPSKLDNRLRPCKSQLGTKLGGNLSEELKIQLKSKEKQINKLQKEMMNQKKNYHDLLDLCYNHELIIEELNNNVITNSFKKLNAKYAK